MPRMSRRTDSTKGKRKSSTQNMTDAEDGEAGNSEVYIDFDPGPVDLMETAIADAENQTEINKEGEPWNGPSNVLEAKNPDCGQDSFSIRSIDHSHSEDTENTGHHNSSIKVENDIQQDGPCESLTGHNDRVETENTGSQDGMCDPSIGHDYVRIKIERPDTEYEKSIGSTPGLEAESAQNQGSVNDLSLCQNYKIKVENDDCQENANESVTGHNRTEESGNTESQSNICEPSTDYQYKIKVENTESEDGPYEILIGHEHGFEEENTGSPNTVNDSSVSHSDKVEVVKNASVCETRTDHDYALGQTESADNDDTEISARPSHDSQGLPTFHSVLTPLTGTPVIPVIGNLTLPRSQDPQSHRLINNSDASADVCESDIIKDDNLFCTDRVVTVATTENAYQELRNNLIRDLHSKYVLNTTAKGIQILQFYEHLQKTVIKSRISINEDFKLRLQVHQIDISENHEIFLGEPSAVNTVKDVNAFLRKLEECQICIGNADDELQELVPLGNGMLVSKQSGSLEYREGDFCALYNNTFRYHSTIRSVECGFFVKDKFMRCKQCGDLRKRLVLRLETIRKNRNKIRQFVHLPYKHTDMTRDMLVEKIKQQADEIKGLETTVRKFQRAERKEKEAEDKAAWILEQKEKKAKEKAKQKSENNMAAMKKKHPDVDHSGPSNKRICLLPVSERGTTPQASEASEGTADEHGFRSAADMDVHPLLDQDTHQVLNSDMDQLPKSEDYQMSDPDDQLDNSDIADPHSDMEINAMFTDAKMEDFFRTKLTNKEENPARHTHKEENPATITHTQKKTQQDMKIFQRWMADNMPEERRKMEEIPPHQLDNILGTFYGQVRKLSGKEYEPDTIKAMQNSFERYLLEKGYDESIMSGDAFKGSRVVLRAKRKQLKHNGLGKRPNRTAPVNNNEEEILWSSGQLGPDNRYSLLHAVWWRNNFFGLRGRQEHRDLKWGDVSIQTDADGMQYLEYQGPDTKNMELVDKKAFPPRIYATPDTPKRCPVRLHALFGRKRPITMCAPDAPFYLSVSNPSVLQPSIVWYKAKPLGVHALGNIMKTMSITAGLQSNLTHHTGRKTTLKRLREAGVESCDITEFTRQRQISNILVKSFPSTSCTSSLDSAK